MADTEPAVAFPVEATRVSGRRLIAHVIDLVLVGLVFMGVIAVGLVLGAVGGTVGGVVNIVLLVAGFAWLIAGHLAWFVRQERRAGQTVGKRATGIRVVTADGRVPSGAQLWKRSLPLLIEYLYVFALLGMLSSEHRRRFGDRWGGTYVVDVEKVPLSPG